MTDIDYKQPSPSQWRAITKFINRMTSDLYDDYVIMIDGLRASGRLDHATYCDAVRSLHDAKMTMTSWLPRVAPRASMKTVVEETNTFDTLQTLRSCHAMTDEQLNLILDINIDEVYALYDMNDEQRIQFINSYRHAMLSFCIDFDVLSSGTFDLDVLRLLKRTDQVNITVSSYLSIGYLDEAYDLLAHNADDISEDSLIEQIQFSLTKAGLSR